MLGIAATATWLRDYTDTKTSRFSYIIQFVSEQPFSNLGSTDRVEPNNIFCFYEYEDS